MKPGFCCVLWLLAMAVVSSAEPADQLLLYTVEESGSDGTRLVDTAEFPKLGYISKQPAMRIAKLKKVTFNSAPADGKAAIPAGAQSDLTIELADKDAKEFGKLTLKAATNTNRIALFLGNQLLAAVKVVDPIYEGKISVSSSNEESLRELEKKLKVLVSESPGE